MMVFGLYLQLEKSIQRWMCVPEKQEDAQILQDILLIFVRKPVCENLTIARIYYNATVTKEYKELDSVLAVFLRQMICTYEESLIYMKNTYKADAPISVADKEIKKCVDLIKSFLPIAYSEDKTAELIFHIIHKLDANKPYDKEMVFFILKGLYPGSIDFFLAKKIIVQILGFIDSNDTFLTQLL